MTYSTDTRETDQLTRLMVDLRKQRHSGFFRAEWWWEKVPTLAELARQAQGDSKQPVSDAIEATLRQAAQNLDEGGRYSTAAGYLFGLAARDRSLTLGERRAKAAAVFYVEPESFRRRHEKRILAALADQVLRLAWRGLTRTVSA